jgi:hypothetical protein
MKSPILVTPTDTPTNNAIERRGKNPMEFVNLIGWLGNKYFTPRLQKTGPVFTFARLCTSRHLVDLQVIASCMIYAVVAFAFFIPSMSHEQALTSAGAVIASTLAVLSWAYQTGSRRIGSVDLFACEISAICRVCLVVDFAQSCLQWAKSPGVPSKGRTADRSSEGDGHFGPLKKFTSEEQYTPVYDKNLSDLQPLDVNVVTYVTEFYTYRKTMMDILRHLAATDGEGERRMLIEQMIYMQFLMYESARYAIDELVEFEPNKAESLVNILSSELPLYGFLRTLYKQDNYRYKRLRLRQPLYRAIVPKLCRQIDEAKGGHWKRAKASADVMRDRYEELMTMLKALAKQERSPDIGHVSVAAG